MKKLMRAAGAIPAALSLALVLPAAPASAVATPATIALQYLSANQPSDGSLDSSPGETEDMVFGAAANGYDPRTLRARQGCATPFDFLAAKTSDGTAYKDSHGNPVPAKVAKLTLAVLAGKFNPRAFGAPNAVDLLATLQSTYVAGTGSFGAANFAFDQSLAIMALKLAADVSYPVPAMSVTYLKGLQDVDGGWGYGGSSDTNSTAMALMALASVADSGGRASALTYLHGQQSSTNTGGFTFAAAPSTDSDPDSDAIVIQALTAVGEDPSSASWTVSGHTAPQDLLAFQDTNNSDTAFGGFAFVRGISPGNQPDTFTTSQVPAGAAPAAFPIAPSYQNGSALPGATCSVAAASPSPLASPSPSPSPSASPAQSNAGAGASPTPVPVELARTGGGPAAPAPSGPALALGLLLAAGAVVALGAGRRRLDR